MNETIKIRNKKTGEVLTLRKKEKTTESQVPSSSSEDFLVGGATAAGVGATALGAKKIFDVTAPLRTKAAGSLVNQLIKPQHRDYMFGKNPGMGVAREGLFANSLEELHSKVDERLSQLKGYANEVRSLDEHKGKTANLKNALDPFIEAVDRLGKAPETHKAKIDEIYGMVKDLEKNIPKDMDWNNIPTDLAFQMKEVVKDMQKWNISNPSDHITNKALKSVYHNIDKALDEVLPLKEVNSRMANLISAKQAIKNQMEVVSRRDPLVIGNLINLATAPIRSATVKTGLAKVLAEKFGFIPKVAKKSGTAFGVYPMISQALQFSTDPEAAQVSAVGGELAPKGSEEREIQLGRLL